MKKKEVELIVTAPYLRALDSLVEEGIYMNRQTAIRDALRRRFQFYKIEPFYTELAEVVDKIQE